MPSLRSRRHSSPGQTFNDDAPIARQIQEIVTQRDRPEKRTSQIDSSNAETGDTASAQHHSDGTKIVGGSSPSAVNITPPEILHEIYSMLTPRDFDNARRTCSQWMRASLNQDLLESMLKRAGWWDAWLKDCDKPQPYRSSSPESTVWRMSRRFATECLLSGRKTNVERPGFLETGVMDFSGLAQDLPSKTRASHFHPISITSRGDKSHTTSTFSVSSCSRYLLVTTGCMIYIFLLHGRGHGRDSDCVFITSLSCRFEILSATLDTTKPRLVVAALLRNRVGMVCDVDVSTENIPSTAGSVEQTKMTQINSHRNSSVTDRSPHYYYDVCSEDHPPRTIALCPGRRCVAFGCAGGIEIHWVDEVTRQDQRRHFLMSQPSEILHFLPTSPETPMEMRLISSLAGPGVHECACRQSPFPDHPKKCQFHLLADVQSVSRRGPPNTPSLSLVRATHCHHYRAVPINDGFHIIFVEPRTGLLCIGSDAPIGGPTSLTRAFVCVPPFSTDPSNTTKEVRIPTAFAVGSDLSWGLRVVAAYQDRIVLYSVPLDVFNVIRKERERQGDSVMGDSDLARDWFVDSERFRKRRESLVQNQNGDWEFLLSVSYQPTAMMWPFKIYGKEIGRAENLVELSLQSSHGGARIWAFSASGEAHIFDLDTFTSTSRDAINIPCRHDTLGADGSLESSRFVDRSRVDSTLSRASRKRKAAELQHGFVGRYGSSRYVPGVSLDGLEPGPTSMTANLEDSAARRPSFAACIVDFKIPELGSRDGPWKDPGRLL
ncbi:hypothetical protein N7492_001957 [Penicillium capsulatum]|uniref:F-box domain-containing protein n=1 Tax=Penicillium capsulatum TaxID=69766 RepID=A0A9W9LVW8_9EURO|nr:hypothetical protein N7492_001957 [Penicillium capsulatum]KAJ6123421.1 hypothetical protein N7512_005886 [Penicillium capsulatum]